MWLERIKGLIGFARAAMVDGSFIWSLFVISTLFSVAYDINALLHLHYKKDKKKRNINNLVLFFLFSFAALNLCVERGAKRSNCKIGSVVESYPNS